MTTPHINADLSRPPAKLAARLLALVLAWGLAACASPPPPASPPPAPGEVTQKVVIRVLDSRDRPVAGAEVKITPQAGRPQEPGPHLTDERGELVLAWLPQVTDELASTHSPDQVHTYLTKLAFTVQAQGFLSAPGRIETSGRHRLLANPELQKLGNKLALGSHTETLVLRRPGDIFAPSLGKRPADDPLAARCRAFFDKNRLLAPRLGAEFAWPSFDLRGDTLTISFQWRGITWGGLKAAPLAARVALTSGVPLAMAAGQDLLPLAGVGRLVIEFHSQLPPEGGDNLAAPRPAKVVLAAPAQAVLDLAQRRLSSDRFLSDHPPQLVVQPHPGG